MPAPWSAQRRAAPGTRPQRAAQRIDQGRGAAWLPLAAAGSSSRRSSGNLGLSGLARQWCGGAGGHGGAPRRAPMSDPAALIGFRPRPAGSGGCCGWDCAGARHFQRKSAFCPNPAAPSLGRPGRRRRRGAGTCRSSESLRAPPRPAGGRAARPAGSGGRHPPGSLCLGGPQSAWGRCAWCCSTGAPDWPDRRCRLARPP